MAEAKHSFVDDYPYLVYTAEQGTLVYSNKADTSIDDIPSGGGKLGKPLSVTAMADFEDPTSMYGLHSFSIYEGEDSDNGFVILQPANSNSIYNADIVMPSGVNAQIVFASESITTLGETSAKLFIFSEDEEEDPIITDFTDFTVIAEQASDNYHPFLVEFSIPIIEYPEGSSCSLFFILPKLV